MSEVIDIATRRIKQKKEGEEDIQLPCAFRILYGVESLADLKRELQRFKSLQAMTDLYNIELGEDE